MKASRVLRKGELAKGGDKALEDRHDRVKLMKYAGRSIELILAKMELDRFLATL